MPLQNPQDTIFYTIEKAIKSYRQFAQRNINAKGLDITLDQALLLRALHDYPTKSQSDISRMIFKDFASVTRMIELLVKKGCLERSYHESDRRRHTIELSKQGKLTLRKLNKVVADNRANAQKNMTGKELEAVRKSLSKIIENCN